MSESGHSRVGHRLDDPRRYGTTASLARGSRALALCIGVLAAFLFADVDAYARIGLPGGATPASDASASASDESGHLYAQRRRRRKRKRRRRRRPRRRPRKVQKPKTLKSSAFPEQEKAAESAPPPQAGGALRRGARVEFDGRLVQGQTAKSGAIYLFARKRSELRSMVTEREQYRREILRTVYPQDEYKAHLN